MKSRHALRPEVSRLDGRVLLSHSGAKQAALKAEVAANDPAVTPTEGNTYYDLKTWDAFHNSYVAAAKADRPRVEFLGDSITYFWQNPYGQSRGSAAWNSVIEPLDAENYGIEGDRTQSILWRVENGEVAGHPKVLVLMAGINNLGLGATPEETAAGVSAIVSAIHKESPRTKVLLLGLLPNEVNIPSESNANVAATDAILSTSFKAKPFVSYLDLSGDFEASDGIPNPALYSDGLHPSAAGYQVLADDLVGPIEDLLAGRLHPRSSSKSTA